MARLRACLKLALAVRCKVAGGVSSDSGIPRRKAPRVGLRTSRGGRLAPPQSYKSKFYFTVLMCN